MDLSPILTVSRPFLGDIYHGQIQHFQETVIGWKYRLGFGDFPELAVKSFNRVRGIDQTADFLVKHTSDSKGLFANIARKKTAFFRWIVKSFSKKK